MELKSDKPFFSRCGKSRAETKKLSCLVTKKVLTEVKNFRKTEGEFVGKSGKFTIGKFASFCPIFFYF